MSVVFRRHLDGSRRIHLWPLIGVGEPSAALSPTAQLQQHHSTGLFHLYFLTADSSAVASCASTEKYILNSC